MKPFPTMPYDYPPGICYPLTECCMYVLFILCCVHAYKKGMGPMMYLLGGLGFGLLLEYVNVATNAGYKYGQFWVMFGKAPHNIPLCIGTGWAIIMYTARLITDALGISLWKAAALDALLAISIDLSMDVVAYRLHMWHWDWESRGAAYNVLTSQWFGVPYGNFYGWLCVVFFYSSFARLLERVRIGNPALAKVWPIFTPVLSIIISQAALWLALFTITDFLRMFGITSAHRLIALLVLFTVMAVMGYAKRKGDPAATTSLPVITWLVPVWFHLYFFSWFFIAGFYKENTWMTVWAVINILVSVFIHWALFIKPRYTPALVKVQQ
ncbi:carotenoid biosynthesis protein [Chitinophaga agrisoli]|uniref:Carotenoid biosynthesis protein n=2 Tax=Chitinophaga agrisoli TaxID=2607653 RepID=A0A5B2W2C8_9BACT|nr:carotenoid biosynthesis protein [Chitinophaga agrisoli]